MSLFQSIQWNIGSFINFNAKYGVITYLILAIIITHYQNSILDKDKKCSDHLWLTYPKIILLILGLFSAVSALYLTGFANRLINNGNDDGDDGNDDDDE